MCRTPLVCAASTRAICCCSARSVELDNRNATLHARARTPQRIGVIKVTLHELNMWRICLYLLQVAGDRARLYALSR